jgi:putative tryptophan/tyrosine transport system substrate-binding protein
MRRRTFVATLTTAILAAPFATHGQRTGKVSRIGYLTPTDIPRTTLINALRELGYVDGETMTLEVRSAQNDLDRLPQLAAELVAANVDVIVAVSPPAIKAASQATKTTPIVMAFWGAADLIESGIVASFARPGKNVTGIYMLAAEMEAKRLELLLGAIPNAKRIAVLNPDREWATFTAVRRVAQTAKIHLYLTDIPGPGGYAPVFEAIAKEHADALLVPSFPRFYQEQQQIIEMAARRRLPAMYEWGDMARVGGLIAYGPVIAELNRRVARYVDKIVKGAKPADLPIEQPTKFELVINMKTAKALGLTIPQSLVLRADEVIE